MVGQRRPASLVLAGALALGVAACGDDEDYANDLRPPSPIIVTASIGPEEIAVSPRRFGAGPVNLVVTNQTDAPQQVTFESSGGEKGFRQQTAPINPRDTATLKADVPEGEAVIGVSGVGIEPAGLRVGPQRKSSQDELLQP